MGDVLTTEELAQLMHESYEATSTAVGWDTQPRCRVPWPDLPAANKRVMREVAEVARRECDPRYRDRVEIEALRSEVERMTKERDEARRMYCARRAVHQLQGSQNRECPYVVAASNWGKAEADRLFPAGCGK